MCQGFAVGSAFQHMIMNDSNLNNAYSLKNKYILWGLFASGVVPSIIFLIFAFVEGYSEAGYFLVVFSFVSLFPGFLGISLPCWVLLWRGKTSPLFFAVTPPCVTLPLVLLLDPYGGGINYVPVFFAIATAITAFGGLLCWFISVRLDPQFQKVCKQET